MFEAKTSYAKIAYEAILYYLTTGKTKDQDSEISTDLKLKIPCFVAIFDAKNSLRGISGSTEFKTNNLFEEITEKTILAATEGANNSPVIITELSNLKTEVYLLSSITRLNSTDDLKPKKDGLALTIDHNKHFILPDVDKIRSPEKMIAKLFGKANIEFSGNLNDYDIETFRITKYD